MANYATLKAAVADVIKTNGQNQITGALLQSTLNTIIDALGAGYQFMGVATPSTNPGTVDQRVFYLAATAGNYANFNNIVVGINEFAILKYGSSWTKETIEVETAENIQFFNCNFYNGRSTSYGTLLAARQSVASNKRKIGLVITYLYENKWRTEQFIGANISGWETESNWQLLSPDYLRFNSKVFTINEYANKVVRHLFIDTSGYNGEYSLAGLRLRGIICAQYTGYVRSGLIIENANGELIANEWYDDDSKGVPIQQYVSNGVFVYAELNWDNLPSGTDRILNVDLTNEVFEAYNDPRLTPKVKVVGNHVEVDGVRTVIEQDFVNVNEINSKTDGYSSNTAAHNAVPESIRKKGLTAAYLSNVDGIWHIEQFIGDNIADWGNNDKWQPINFDYIHFNSKVFTKHIVANRVVRKLFLDTSGYTGSLSLTGLRLRNLYNDGTNQCGFILENGNEELIFAHWYYEPNVAVQEFTEVGIYAYAEFNWDNMPSGSDRILGVELTNEVFQQYNDPRKVVVVDSDIILGAAGDSITNAAHYPINNDNDPYNPITGNKNKSWAYYIAKHYNIRWHNYGNSGSTMGDCIVADYDQRGFSKANGRYTQMADNLTHITIWFGWNDAHYGPRMRKQMWVQSTYQNNHWYPANNDEQYIGQPGYVTQAEYDAVNAVTGSVGGIQYNNSEEYWNAVYVGTKDDTTNKTFWGAFNIVLPYLINKYPYAKILVISPYNTNELMRAAARDAAFKFGLQCYDFGKDQNQMFAYGWQDENEQGMIGSQTVEQFRVSTLLYDGTHPSLDGNKYLYPSIGAKLMSL